MKQLSKKHWNDEMMDLEKQPMSEKTIEPKIPTEEEWVASGLESWDWRFRAEEAEAKVKQLESELKDYENLIEQARIGLYQLQHNFTNMRKNTTRLLKQCHKLLDPTLFYYDLDPNPAVRKRQIEERTQAKHDLMRALEIYFERVEGKDGDLA